MVFHNNRNIWYMYWDVTWRRWRQHLIRPIMHAWSIKISELLYRARTYHELRYQMFNPPPQKKTSEIVAIYVFTTFVCRKGDSKPQHFTHRASVLVNEHNMLYFCGGFLVVFYQIYCCMFLWYYKIVAVFWCQFYPTSTILNKPEGIHVEIKNNNKHLMIIINC